jgi:hypothetical protein
MEFKEWRYGSIDHVFIVALLLILVMRNENWYMGDFLESFIWSSMDHSKDHFRNYYLIFKLNYFISFLITTSILKLLHSFPYTSTWIHNFFLSCVFSCPWNVYELKLKNNIDIIITNYWKFYENIKNKIK